MNTRDPGYYRDILKALEQGVTEADVNNPVANMNDKADDIAGVMSKLPTDKAKSDWLGKYMSNAMQKGGFADGHFKSMMNDLSTMTGVKHPTDQINPSNPASTTQTQNPAQPGNTSTSGNNVPMAPTKA